MKNELRTNLKQKRKLICSKEKDIKIVENLLSIEEYKQAKHILAYYPLKYEPDIKICLEKKDKIWYLPRINGGNLDLCPYDKQKLRKGSFNIIEPETGKINDYCIIETVIAPAVGADKSGYRLGYGKGYYDRLFRRLKKGCIKIFITYEELFVDTIYPDNYDIKGDYIITERKIYKI